MHFPIINYNNLERGHRLSSVEKEGIGGGGLGDAALRLCNVICFRSWIFAFGPGPLDSR